MNWHDLGQLHPGVRSHTSFSFISLGISLAPPPIRPIAHNPCVSHDDVWVLTRQPARRSGTRAHRLGPADRRAGRACGRGLHIRACVCECRALALAHEQEGGGDVADCIYGIPSHASIDIEPHTHRTTSPGLRGRCGEHAHCSGRVIISLSLVGKQSQRGDACLPAATPTWLSWGQSALRGLRPSLRVRPWLWEPWWGQPPFQRE